MRNSLEDWKRVPTTASVVFGIDLPYRPPKNAFGAFLWRRRLWIETTWGLSVLEPWEKLLTLAVFYFVLTLVFTGLYKFVPQQVPHIYRRSIYYLFGNDDAETAVTSVRKLMGGWVERNASILHL